MSAFALPIPPRALTSPLHRPTERSATTPEDRKRRSDIRTAAMEAGEHPGNLPILAPPPLGNLVADIPEIAAIERPDLHLIGRAQRHHDKAAELRLRLLLAAEPFGQVGADRFRRPPDLIRQRELLDPRELEARPVHLQRQPVGPPEHAEILDTLNPFAHTALPVPVF